jgi:anti-anti-sigma factor
MNGHHVVEVDLSQTEVMDCAGLGALIAVRNLACSRNTSVRLLRPTPPVQQLFEVMRVGEFFDVAQVYSREEASFQVVFAPGQPRAVAAAR